MHPLLEQKLQGQRLLLAVASPVEVRGVFAAFDDSAPVPPLWGVTSLGRVDVLHTGVGKANAAGALASHLAHHIYGAVVNVGIAGSLPGPGTRLVPGGIIAATGCAFADEGLVTPDGYRSLSAMGFPMDPTLAPTSTGHTEVFPTDAVLAGAFRCVVDAESVIATVSTCSGTDAAARVVVERTGALAEAMEGAALALVARRCGVAFCEVRAISNFTGDRAAQGWDIAGALARLGDALRRVVVER